MKKDKKKKCKICKKVCKNRNAWLRHRRRRHPEIVLKAKERSNKSNYGQTAKEYDEQCHKQGDCCAICGRPKKNVAFHQDHNHAIAQLKITCVRNGKLWEAFNKKYKYRYFSRSKKKAIREVRLKLKRRSRRGAICWHCNSGLRKWQQKGGWIDPQHLRKAADYMEHWQKEQKWKKVQDGNK